MPVETETEAALVQLEATTVIESYEKLGNRRFGVTCSDANHMTFLQSLPDAAELSGGPEEYDFVVIEPETTRVVRSK